MEVVRTSKIHAPAPRFCSCLRSDTPRISSTSGPVFPSQRPRLHCVGQGRLAMCRRFRSGKVAYSCPRYYRRQALPLHHSLHLPDDAPHWQFYHPATHRVLSFEDVTLMSRFATTPDAVDSGATGGGDAGGAGSGGAGSGGADSGDVGSGGAERPSGGGVEGTTTGVSAGSGHARAGGAGGSCHGSRVAGGPGGSGAVGTGAGGAGPGGADVSGAGGSAAGGTVARGAGAGSAGVSCVGATTGGAGGCCAATAAVTVLLRPAIVVPATTWLGTSPGSSSSVCLSRAAYYSELTYSLTEHREPASRPASLVARRAHRVHPLPIHTMALRPSSVAQRPVLLSPPASSLPNVPNPESDLARAASPTVTRCLATLFTDPTFESTVASALVSELVYFAAVFPLDYFASLISESNCPLSIEGYVDAVPPPRVNIVDGRWISRVKRLPGSPLVFKARYIARGFSQRQGVDIFQNFSPTLKMATLWVVLQVPALRVYELHSHDFSTTFLQGSLHEEIWLCRPHGFTGSFPKGTQRSLRRPVYSLCQAPREWHDTLRTTVARHTAAIGFAPSNADPSLFLCTNPSLPPFYILVYIDNLVFATADTKALALVKAELHKRHTCTDLGPSALPLSVLLATVHSSAYESLALSSTFGRVRSVEWSISRACGLPRIPDVLHST
ncbi:unnamed protein product [Closterium sp. NIES-53]